MKLLSISPGIAECLEYHTELAVGQGCRQDGELMPSIVGKIKIKICSIANFFSPSFLKFLIFFLCFNVYLFMKLAACSFTANRWLVSSGHLRVSVTKQILVTSGQQGKASHLCCPPAKAWSRKSAMQIFVHYMSSIAVCWQSSRWLRHASSGSPAPKGQCCHLFCEIQVGYWSLVCRDYAVWRL